MHTRLPLLAVALLAACSGGGEELPGVGLVGSSVNDPYPSRLHLDEDGTVAVAELVPWVELPRASGGRGWRRGWSPGQTAVVLLPGLDPSALPHWTAPEPGTGSVRLLDVTAGAWLPAFAELDARPGTGNEPALIVRPMAALPAGHDVAVVITTDAVARPERFAALVDGDPPADLEALEEPTRPLLDAAAALGLPEAEIALAWDFPVEDGHGVLDAALALRDEADVGFTLDTVRNGADASPGAFRTVEGTYTVTGITDEEGFLATDADGALIRTGTFEMDLWVHIPEQVADAPAGSVPVVIFGHGIFGKPRFYLDESTDVTAMLAACGCIGVASSWRGLSRDDLGLATEAGADFGKLPRIPGLLAQSQLGLRQLAEALRAGDLLDDPVFQGRSGQSLPSEDLDYYGISLGGIQGAVFLEAGAPVDQAVLHVPGSMWSTMLERSSNYTALELLLSNNVPLSHERQLLYAWSQQHWDPADPIGRPGALGADTPVLLQEALGDEQVPNLTTRALVRSAGLPAVGPTAEPAWGLEPVDAPFTGSGWVQYRTGKAPPVDANQPAEVSGAHDFPRHLPEQREQTLTFLREGTIVHLCGDDPCGPEQP